MAKCSIKIEVKIIGFDSFIMKSCQLGLCIQADNYLNGVGIN